MSRGYVGYEACRKYHMSEHCMSEYCMSVTTPTWVVNTDLGSVTPTWIVNTRMCLITPMWVVNMNEGSIPLKWVVNTDVGLKHKSNLYNGCHHEKSTLILYLYF